MEHQYPAAISGDESMLAELMLPDQTHVRSQDWTIFFLHKDTSGDDDDGSENGKKKKKRKSKYRGNEEGADIQNENIDEPSDGDSSEDEDDEEGGEGPPLMYVLNLVNTKQDNTVRRYGTFPVPFSSQDLTKRIVVPLSRPWRSVRGIHSFTFTK